MKKYANYKEDFKLEKRRRFISKAAIRLVVIAIFAGGLVVVLFFAKLFDVRTIAVESSSNISAEQVEAQVNTILDRRRLGIPRRSNSLIFSPQKLQQPLLQSFPRIESLEIRRTSLHAITITIHERVSVGLWCLPAQQKCFYYDADGIAFSEVLPSSGFLFVPVNDYRSRSITLGNRVAPESWRTSILEVKKILQFGDITTSEVIIPADSFNEFDVVVREGWRILYAYDQNVRKQTNSLLVFLKEKMTPGIRKNLDYIDLRIEDRIYYTEK